ncbi:hypothetical protein G9A89_006566 [Geosiphon pyriformis]|nr:hypothetical protein G9A89_006566 [Geosiphon pyriformis]
MFTKKLAKDVTTNSVSGSLRQKTKVLLRKVKHSGNKADLSFKIPASNSSQYENMDISSDKKLGHKIGKNLGYGAGSKSDELLDSCTNIPRTKHFNSGIMKAPFLGFCDFGSTIDNIDMDLPPPVPLESSLHLVASVKEKLCFNSTKFFALNIGLLTIPESTLCNKLKSVRKLFYKIDGFGGASTSLKFPDIVKASFTSESSLTLAKQLAVSKNFVLIGLWQKVLVEFESSQVTDLVVFKWSILLDKDSAHVAKANANKQTWDLKNSYHTLLYTLPIGTTAHDLSDLVQSYVARKAAICFTPIFKGVNLVWAGLSSPKCATCDKRHFMLIYAKKQAPISRLVFFGGATWAYVVSSFPKNLYSTLLIGNNLSISLVNDSMLTVTILALRVSVLEHLLENVSDQVADISCKLNRLLAVLLASFTVLPTPKHNLVLDMAVDTLLFILSVLSVVTAISQDISPSGFYVLTVKVDGLKTNLAVLKNLVKAILNKLNFFGSGSVTETKLCSSIKPWIANKFPGVRVFTLGLDAEFLGMGIALIMNENLAKHISKISKIPDRLLMVCLLFKNKQSVSVLGLYMETSLDKHIIQAGFVNFFIAKACNESTFVILDDVWVSLDSVNASAIKSFFLLRSYFDAIRSALAKVKKSYYFLKIMESKFVRDFQIRLAINKRMKNFELNKGQTIRNVLEWPFCKVILNYLVVNEDFILESGLVKFHVDKIMEGWTKKHVVVDDILDEWHYQLQLLEYVFDDAFSNVMHPIKVEEILDVVLSLLDNKAANLSGITNKL